MALQGNGTSDGGKAIEPGTIACKTDHFRVCLYKHPPRDIDGRTVGPLPIEQSQ